MEDHPQTVTQAHTVHHAFAQQLGHLFHITVGQHPGWAFGRRAAIDDLVDDHFFVFRFGLTPISSDHQQINVAQIVKQLFFTGTAIPEGIFHRRHNIGHGDDQYGFTA